MVTRFSTGRLRHAIVFAAALVALSVLLLGCGSSSSTTGGSSGGETSSSSSGSSPTDFSSKKIGYLNSSATTPFTERMANAFDYASKSIGWEVEEGDGAEEASKTLTAARTMLSSGVEAIVCAAIPAEWLRPIVAEAEAKHIPIIQLLTEEPPGVYTAQILEEQQAPGKALAEQAIKEHPEGGEVAIYDFGEFPALVERAEAVKAALEGTNLKVVAVQAEAAAESSKFKKDTVDLLTEHPNISVFVSVSESTTPEVLAGLRAAGNTSASVYGWYATSTLGELMETNKQFRAVVDSDIAKANWIAVEELLSYFSGGELKEKQVVEVEPVVVTKADITPGVKTNEGPVPFSEIGAPFEKEWATKYEIK